MGSLPGPTSSPLHACCPGSLSVGIRSWGLGCVWGCGDHGDHPPPPPGGGSKYPPLHARSPDVVGVQIRVWGFGDHGWRWGVAPTSDLALAVSTRPCTHAPLTWWVWAGQGLRFCRWKLAEAEPVGLLQGAQLLALDVPLQARLRRAGCLVARRRTCCREPSSLCLMSGSRQASQEPRGACGRT